MKNTETNRAAAQMLVCAVLWSTAGILIKMIPWNPFAVAGWRGAVAAAVMGVYFAAARVKLRFSRRALLSGFFLAAVALLFVAANKLTTAANAIVLQYVAPVFVLLISAVVLRRKVRRCDMLAAVGTVVGIALFFCDQLAPGNLLGNVLALTAGLFMACMLVTMSEGSDAERMAGILSGMCMTAAAGVPFSFFTETAVNPATVSSILLLGVFQLGISYILYAKAARRCPPLMCSLLGTVEPLLNPVWVLLFNGERPGLFALAGGVIVLGVVTLWCVYRDRHPEEAQEAQ